MIPMTIEEIASAVDGVVASLSIDRDGVVATTKIPRVTGEGSLTAVTADSRTLSGNAAARSSIFVALRTPTSDGHRYLRDALAHDVGTILVEAAGIADVNAEPIGSPLHSAPVIIVDDTWLALRRLAGWVRATIDPRAVGITGSVGKTTVKDLTTSLLSSDLRCHASFASFNNELGVPLTLLSMPVGCEVVVCEIGARAPGDIATLAAIVAPDIAIVTAVAPAHLGPFGSIEAIAETKAELVDALDDRGVAVLNVDDDRVAAMAHRAPSVIGASINDPSADIVAQRVRMLTDGRADVTIATPWGQVAALLPVPGRHQVMNAMLAVGAAGVLGMSAEAMAHHLEHAQVSQWRGQLVQLAREVTVIDDAYNANPASVAAALDTLAVVGEGRRTIAVLGEMAELGPSSDDAHRSVGVACWQTKVDVVVAVGPNAAGIDAGARAAGHGHAISVTDGDDAIEWLDQHLEPRDVVLVKASRVVGLERVVAHLQARYAAGAVGESTRGSAEEHAQ